MKKELLEKVKKNPSAYYEIEEDFALYVEKIKQLGYRVYVTIWGFSSDNHITSAHIRKGESIGYVEYKCFRGLYRYTVHKTCRECGSGFGLESMYGLTLENVTKDAIDAIFKAYPGWATPSQRKGVRKYTFDEWLDERSKSTVIVEI